MNLRFPSRPSRPFAVLLPIAFFALTVAGCGKEVVRGANDPSIDSKALSTGLDKDDIQRALHETLNNLRAAPVMKYFAPSCLPYFAACSGLNTGCC